MRWQLPFRLPSGERKGTSFFDAYGIQQRRALCRTYDYAISLEKKDRLWLTKRFYVCGQNACGSYQHQRCPPAQSQEPSRQALYFGTNATPIEMDFSDKRPRSRGKSCKTIRWTRAADAAAIRADSKRIHSQSHSIIHDVRTMQGMPWRKA